MVYLGQLLWGLGLAEAVLFVVIAGKIGLFKTLLILPASAFVGLLVVRRQGLSALTQLSDAFQKRAPAAKTAIDALCVLAAGFLFIFPGLLSDLLAVLFLIPQLRRALGGKVFGHTPVYAPASPQPFRDDDVIDVDFRRVDDPPPQVEKQDADR